MINDEIVRMLKSKGLNLVFIKIPEMSVRTFISHQVAYPNSNTISSIDYLLISGIEITTVLEKATIGHLNISSQIEKFISDTGDNVIQSYRFSKNVYYETV